MIGAEDGTQTCLPVGKSVFYFLILSLIKIRFDRIE